MRLGIDRFFDEGGARRLEGKRWALLAHHASRDGAGRHLLSRLRALGLEPELLLAPEHGLWGLAQDMEAVDSARDPLFGHEVWSLYGAEVTSLTLPRSLLGGDAATAPSDAPGTAPGGFEVLLVDLQDVGSRYYTYAATLLMLMEQLSGRGVHVIVLDRPNPLGGLLVEGNHVQAGFRSFVGHVDIPNRHGLSLGELALLHQRREALDLELEIWTVDGWQRERPAPAELGFFWPSPNMPSLEAALIYPGMCLIEGTNLSEGRGTTRPFHVVGAPWVDAEGCAARLEGYRLPGLRFLPFLFRPMFGKWAGETCHGLHLLVTEPERVLAWETGLCVLSAFQGQHPEQFQWRHEAYEFVQDRLAIDLLLGDDQCRPQLEAGADPRALARAAAPIAQAFRAECDDLLLYRP